MLSAALDIVQLFSVKIASKQEVLDGEDGFQDINVVWVFTFNSNRPFFYFEFFVITFLLALSILVTVIGIYCAGKANFPHRNHRLLVIAGIFCWFELVISRFLVFFYQFYQFRIQGNLESSKTLFWAAIFRYHYMFFGVHTVLSVTVERAMATFLISDYEKKSRIWIPIFLIFSNFIFSTVYSFLAAWQFLKMKLMFLNTLITTLSAIILLEIVFFMNRRRLKSLNVHDKEVQYTLSIRYQVQENVQSCKLIRAAVITIGTLIIFIILTECLPVLLDFSDDARTWCNRVFDTLTHINALIVVPTVTYLIDGPRKVFINCFWAKIQRKFKISKPRERRKSIKKGIGKQTEGDIYFAMFDKSVNKVT